MVRTSLKPVGEWLGGSFGLLGGRWLTLSLLFVFGCCAVVFGVVLVYLLGVVFIGTIYGWENLARVASDPRKLQYLFEGAGQTLTIFNLLAAFIALRLYSWILLAAIHASTDTSLGFRAALGRAKGRGYAFLVLFVLQQAILNVGMLLLILPGLILAVWLGFSLWSFAREKTGVFESLGRSARLVKGNFFGVLGRMLLLVLIGGAMMIVPVAGWLVGGAWIMLAWGVLFADLQALHAPVPAARPVSTARPLVPGPRIG